MPDTPREKPTGENRPFGSGIPVIHQGELSGEVREVFHATFPYEPFTDRFALPSVSLRIEERWPDGVMAARVMLRTAGWRSLPGLPEEIAEDEDIEDAFLGMATRLPASYVEQLVGAKLQYDTNSFLREEDRRSYRMEYRVMGTPAQIVDAVQELRRANDIRWKKAHMMLGYRPGGEEHSDERARELTDRMYGPGTWEQWSEQIKEYDQGLGAFYQKNALANLKPPPPPMPQDIAFTNLMPQEPEE